MDQHDTNPAPSVDETRATNWATSGGVIGALLTSVCCIGPLVLLLLGVTGAWIGHLTALEPYKPFFAAVALVFIGIGFWQIYFKSRPVCKAGSYCAKPGASILTQVSLWAASVLVGLALTISWWAPLFY